MQTIEALIATLSASLVAALIFTPTLGALIILIANHTMMHAGQFTVVRRKLGKPVIF